MHRDWRLSAPGGMPAQCPRTTKGSTAAGAERHKAAASSDVLAKPLPLDHLFARDTPLTHGLSIVDFALGGTNKNVVQMRKQVFTYYPTVPMKGLAIATSTFEPLNKKGMRALRQMTRQDELVRTARAWSQRLPVTSILKPPNTVCSFPAQPCKKSAYRSEAASSHIGPQGIFKSAFQQVSKQVSHAPRRTIKLYRR